MLQIKFSQNGEKIRKGGEVIQISNEVVFTAENVNFRNQRKVIGAVGRILFERYVKTQRNIGARYFDFTLPIELEVSANGFEFESAKLDEVVKQRLKISSSPIVYRGFLNRLLWIVENLTKEIDHTSDFFAELDALADIQVKEQAKRKEAKKQAQK